MPIFRAAGQQEPGGPTVNTESAHLSAADVAEMLDGDMCIAMVGQRRTLVAKLQGTLYAVDAECTHDGGPLIEGTLEGDTIVCPWHFSRFCLRTGEVIDSPALDPLPTYAVDVVDGFVALQRRD
jgi:nitrite reductase/ring-hydroxylating ferredoxin subunit